MKTTPKHPRVREAKEASDHEPAAARQLRRYQIPTIRTSPAVSPHRLAPHGIGTVSRQEGAA